MTARILTCSLLFLLIAADIGLAQERNSYEERRAELAERQQTTREQIENLREQIETYNERLGFATERYEQMYRQFQELERVIALQQERIRQMNRERTQIDEEIRLIEENMSSLENQLRNLIDEYKQTLTFIYKNGRTTELALLLTSTSFNQLMVRSYYLGKFDQHRQAQVSQIEETQAGLEAAKEDLEQARQRNEESLAAIREENQSLADRQQLQRRNVELLRRDRDNLREQVNVRQQQIDELTRVIEELIAEEARIRREEAAGTRAVRRELNISNDELAAFSSSFRESKGQLPWPVDNGTITSRFGLRVHPVFNTRTNNPGVEISAPPRSTIRSVNDGYVFGIEFFQLWGETVLVHHGNYITVYGNLSEIYVGKNQVLNRGDVIGLSGDEDSLIGEVLFFAVRDGSEFINPEEWLQRVVP
jgi:murein hydrolase activator